MAISNTTFQYHTKTWDPGIAQVIKHEVISEQSPRKRKIGDWRRLHVEFELEGTGAALTTEIDELEEIFSLNDGYAALKNADGSLTQHVLDPNASNNWSGVQVIYRSWHGTRPNELVNESKALVVLEAFFEDADSDIIHYEDNFSFSGSGGRIWRWNYRPSGVAFQQTLNLATSQFIRQYGRIYAVRFFPRGNVPPPFFPTWEHQHLRRMDFLYPRHLGKRWYNHGIAWSYEYETPPGVTGTPPIAF